MPDWNQTAVESEVADGGGGGGGALCGDGTGEMVPGRALDGWIVSVRMRRNV